MFIIRLIDSKLKQSLTAKNVRIQRANRKAKFRENFTHVSENIRHAWDEIQIVRNIIKSFVTTNLL